MFKPIRAVLSLFVAAGMFAPIDAVEAQTSVKAGYEPFPSDPVYEYPTLWKTIKKWIDDRNWGRIRNHGWRLFIGANQPAKSNPSLRVFESWYTIPESFHILVLLQLPVLGFVCVTNDDFIDVGLRKLLGFDLVFL